MAYIELMELSVRAKKKSHSIQFQFNITIMIGRNKWSICVELLTFQANAWRKGLDGQ